MVNRYFDGDRPAPGGGILSRKWDETLPAYVEKLASCQLSDALALLWDFVDSANQFVDATQPWTLAKAMKAGDRDAATGLKAALGDLVESCRLVGLAAAPFVPTAAPRALAQLGYGYGYAADGNGGPALLDELRWSAHSAEAGKVATPEPLFPRIETEAATPGAG
jgi:methionyl-tRNA synthetase